MTRRRMVRVVEPVKGLLVEERWWERRKWRVRRRVRMDVMTVWGEGGLDGGFWWGGGGGGGFGRKGERNLTSDG